MFNTLDFLYICLGVGFLILIFTISFTFYNIAKLFKTFRIAIENMNAVGTGIRIGVLTFFKKVLSGRAVNK